MLSETDGNRDWNLSDGLRPIRSALIVRMVMRPMTKVLNPVIRRLAGRRHFIMAAQIHHIGRRSERHYVTPVGAHLKDDVFLILLTFGNQSDWVRNVRAAKGCTIRVNGSTYRAGEPQFLNGAAAHSLLRSMFPITRLFFPLMGIKQFMRLPLLPA
jgi:deazaflavin-dependent oxidoreductase (nitroreductase family)